MRCLSIRSVLRAAITAGLISSCQHATVQASWKDFLPTSTGTCFVHDLNWDRFQTKTNLMESIAKPADLEADMCLAAAKRFELKMQVDAILDSLKSKSWIASQFATKAVVGIVQSRRLLVETIKSHDWKVVEIPETVDSVQEARLSADQVLDFGHDWNCGEWCRDRRSSELVSLPPRDVANIFVYSLEENLDQPEAAESSEPAVAHYDADHSESDYANVDYANVDYANVDYANADYANADDSNADDSNAGYSNADYDEKDYDEKDYSDVDYSNVDYADADYADTDQKEADYADIDNAPPKNDAIDNAKLDDAVVDDVGTANASLDGEYLLSEAERSAWASDWIGSSNPWQVGLDPVCPEIHNSVAKYSVCCPVDNENEAIATALPQIRSIETEVQPEFQAAVRAPRLEAEFDATETEVVLAGDGDEPFEQYAHEYGNPWLNSPFQLNCRLGRRFSFGDNAPRMPKFGPPESVFSREDVHDVSRFPSELNQNPMLNRESVDANLPRSTFSPKDFLTTMHTSTYGAILLPVSNTHRTAVDYAMQLLVQPNSESRSTASHGLASQLRSVGQFLVNFANQIEQQAEQIDIARRENNQR